MGGGRGGRRERVPLRRVGAALRAGGDAMNRAQAAARSAAPARFIAPPSRRPCRPAGVPDPLCLSQPFERGRSQLESG